MPAQVSRVLWRTNLSLYLRLCWSFLQQTEMPGDDNLSARHLGVTAGYLSAAHGYDAAQASAASGEAYSITFFYK